MSIVPAGLWLYRTTFGVVVEHRAADGSQFYVLKRQKWVSAVNRRDLFAWLWKKLNSGSLERLAPERAVRIEQECLPPIDGRQYVMMNGVTCGVSMKARQEEFLRSIMGGELSDAERAELPTWFQERLIDPYAVVGDPRNAAETFFGGQPEECTTTGGFAGFRGQVDLGENLLLPTDAPEPEPTLLMSTDGAIVGFGVGCDQTMRKTEQRSALLLGKAKLGPGTAVLSTAFYIPNPEVPFGFYDVKCTVRRNGEIVYSGEMNTDKLMRPIEELADGVFQLGSYPDGVVVFCGTNSVPPKDWTYCEGDELEVRSSTLGLGLRVKASKIPWKTRASTGLQIASNAPGTRSKLTAPHGELI